MFTDKESIQEALRRTGHRLALMDAGEYALLVCGGAALNVMGLLERPTRDVDVLGIVRPQRASAKQVVINENLPSEVISAAQTVASELNLTDDWLNDSALDVQRLQLPPRILQRAQRQEYGPCLIVFFIGRADQVALKLYAALDRQSGRRHLQDLVAINPTRHEIELALRWLLDRPTSKQFRDAVLRLASGFGVVKFSALQRKTKPRGQQKRRRKRRKRRIDT